MIPDVLLISIVTAFSCALAGNFLVLRKLSLTGDAMSHAVLPAIVVAFFAAGRTLESPFFFLFAVVFCVGMMALIEYFTRSRIREETAIGIVFTFLFAVGVILVVRLANNVHLDLDAVLYGQVDLAQFNRLYFAGFDVGPKALFTMGISLILNLFFLLLFYKELKITSFDKNFSDSIGISSRLMHYLLLFFVSVTVVTAFEAVGAILVLALLIVPAATAYIVANRLHVMLLLSLVFAVLASVFGYLFAVRIDGSIAGSIAAMTGVVLLIVILIQKIRRFFTSQSLLSDLNR